MTKLEALAQKAVEAGDARLNRQITREQHAVIIADINLELIALGSTWDDLNDLLD